MISLESSWKTRQWSASSHAVSQPVNKIKLFTLGFIIHLEDPLPSPNSFLSVPTNQPGAPHLLSPWDFAAGSHSSGMNLSRLEHSAKGHYPGLHVCWVVVLSNSTRCCCDHWVTCEGRVSSCTSSFRSLLSHRPSIWDFILGRQKETVWVGPFLKSAACRDTVKCREGCGSLI